MISFVGRIISSIKLFCWMISSISYMISGLFGNRRLAVGLFDQLEVLAVWVGFLSYCLSRLFTKVFGKIINGCQLFISDKVGQQAKSQQKKLLLLAFGFWRKSQLKSQQKSQLPNIFFGCLTKLKSQKPNTPLSTIKQRHNIGHCFHFTCEL